MSTMQQREMALAKQPFIARRRELLRYPRIHRHGCADGLGTPRTESPRPQGHRSRRRPAVRRL